MTGFRTEPFSNNKSRVLTMGYSSYQEKLLYDHFKNNDIFDLQGSYLKDNELGSLNSLDLCVLPENLVKYYLLDHKFKSTWSYITTLYHAYFLFLCTNDLRIRDLSEIRNLNSNSNRIIRISVPYYHSSEHLFLKLLINLLGLNQDIEIVFHTNADLLKMYQSGKIDICLVLSAHQSKMIHSLSQVQPSHFLRCSELNNGHLHGHKYHQDNVDNQSNFYYDHQMYHKGILNQNAVVPQLYPYVHVLDKNSDGYLPVIRTKLLLCCRSSVPDYIVEFLITRLLLLQKERIGYTFQPYHRFLKDLRISFTKVPVLQHPGARKAFRTMNLITNDQNKHCINWISGLCPQPPIVIPRQPVLGFNPDSYSDDYIKSRFIDHRDGQSKLIYPTI